MLGVYARCAGKPPERVTLSCRTAAGDRRWSADVPRTATDGDTVATLWARRAIQSLEEVNGVGRSARPSPGSREAAEVVRLSKAYTLLSSLTTFVAVEHRTPAERNAGTPATRRVPVMLAAGWGGIDRGVPALRVPGPGGVASRFSVRRRGLDGRRGEASEKLREFTEADLIARRAAIQAALKPRGIAGAPRKAPQPPPSPAPMAPPPVSGPTLAREEVDLGTLDVGRVLREQAAGGEFAWSAELDRLARRRVDGWKDRWPAELSRLGDTDDAKVIETVKVLTLLQVGFADQRPLWQRAAEKAVRFLGEASQQTLAEVTAWLTSI